MNEAPPSERPPAPAAQPAPANPPAPTPQPQLPPASKPARPAAWVKSPLFVWPAAIVLAVLLFFGLGYLNEILTHESTDDAFIAGHVISIAPRIAGQVTAVHVLDNQMVHTGDLMVEIDPADYSTVVAQKQAAAISSDANFHAVIAAYELMQSKVTTAGATLREGQADVDAAAATATNAQANFDRAQNLIKEKTISQQEYDAALAANLKAQADWKSAQETVNEDISKVDEANKSLAATYAEKDVAFAQLTEAQTNTAAAQLNLSYTKIVAPGDGLVTRKSVEPGDYLQVAQEIMSVVPTNVWVVANFKESQLVKMFPGQPVDITIDALGGKKFRGHVDSIQAGSGAQFSLLPPENATGNFVKVVQRVPVKILFDDPLPGDHTIGPGLSVTPDVQVSKYSPPVWALVVISLAIAFAAAWIFLSVNGRKDSNA